MTESLIMKNPLIPMEYQQGKDIEIISYGRYKEHQFCILNMGGTHPCAYVENKFSTMVMNENEEEYMDEKLDFIDVHGGFSFGGYPATLTDNIIYLGWDYMHGGDYSAYDPRGKKWTTEEILKEIFSVIEQLIPLEEEMKIPISE